MVPQDIEAVEWQAVERSVLFPVEERIVSVAAGYSRLLAEASNDLMEGHTGLVVVVESPDEDQLEDCIELVVVVEENIELVDRSGASIGLNRHCWH